jgi:hypothetical protein
VNPFEVTELSKSDVIGLHGVRQDASVDFTHDCGIVFGRVDPMSRLILDCLEVDDFEQDGNAGIESDVHEHTNMMERNCRRPMETF